MALVTVTTVITGQIAKMNIVLATGLCVVVIVLVMMVGMVPIARAKEPLIPAADTALSIGSEDITGKNMNNLVVLVCVIRDTPVLGGNHVLTLMIITVMVMDSQFMVIRLVLMDTQLHAVVCVIQDGIE